MFYNGEFQIELEETEEEEIAEKQEEVLELC